MPWNNLQHKQVRHLAWACFSKPLLTASAMWPAAEGVLDFIPELCASRLRWLEELDSDPTPLLGWLVQSRSHRLGIYFERLWSFFIHADPQFELIAQNLAVRDGGRTVGEFDLLFRDINTQQAYHLEMAVKYYLAAPGYVSDSDNTNASWIGPGCKDRLDLKLGHLRYHQLRLASHPMSVALLQSLGLSSPQPALALRGQLFNKHAAPISPPQGMSSTAHSWVALPNLHAITGGADCLWKLPSKFDWFGLWQTGERQELMDTATLEKMLYDRFLIDHRPVLLVAVGPFRDSYRELRRYFITPGDWPLAAMVEI